MESTPSNWRKSSYSGNRGDCVEVAEASKRVHVRGTQNRPLGHLTFSGSGWSALLSSLRGEDAAG